MEKCIIKKTKIEGLLVIEKPTYFDDRGFYREIIQLRDLKNSLLELNIEFEIKQWNHSLSKPNVIRGIHAENWNKLIYVVSGKMYAAFVDLRPESKTFGLVEEMFFEDPNDKVIFIEKGIGNSICNIGDTNLNYIYLVDAYYDGSDTTAISWNDPDINIKWPIKAPIISDRDKNNPTMRQKFPNKFI